MTSIDKQILLMTLFLCCQMASCCLASDIEAPELSIQEAIQQAGSYLAEQR